MSALTDEERAIDWRERERKRVEEERREQEAKRAAAEHAFEARLARMRAVDCNDGDGVCLYCRVALGQDANGNDTHPDNGCAGPPRACSECGKPWAYVKSRWVPTCNAAEHDERQRAAAWQLAVPSAQHDVFAPPRVYKDADD